MSAPTDMSKKFALFIAVRGDILNARSTPEPYGILHSPCLQCSEVREHTLPVDVPLERLAALESKSGGVAAPLQIFISARRVTLGLDERQNARSLEPGIMCVPFGLSIRRRNESAGCLRGRSGEPVCKSHGLFRVRALYGGVLSVHLGFRLTASDEALHGCRAWRRSQNQIPQGREVYLLR